MMYSDTGQETKRSKQTKYNPSFLVKSIISLLPTCSKFCFIMFAVKETNTIGTLKFEARLVTNE